MSTSSYIGLKFSKGDFQNTDDTLTVEESIRITINAVPFTVTMRTPGSEEELVRGLLFTENIYNDLSTDLKISIREKSEAGFITEIEVSIPPEKIGPGMAISRNIMSVSSCGICGKSALEMNQEGMPPIAYDQILDPASVTKMFAAMNAKQDTFKKSGGSHAAAAFDTGGNLLTIQEDIGRHNAVDKVIGSLILKKQLPAAKCLLVSGRISYEIVNKCFVAGIPFLAAVSAPSSMAVDVAEKCGITLMAFCREDKMTVYSHKERIIRISDLSSELNTKR